MRERKKRVRRYTIGIVADTFGVHEQTLRLYEREGLLTPSRSEKNTRYYTDEDLEKLKMILNLTRDMGVNLAGVQIILNMREQMDEMKREFNRFLSFIREQMHPEASPEHFNISNALVRITPTYMIHVESEIQEPRPVTLRPVKPIKIETDSDED
ncbi:MAG: helix-turn-helix transcriptional regulator [Blastocatellia bacterium]|nr:helix-turn-helix transcriptional regulator [Blastocatellia bacterium]